MRLIWYEFVQSSQDEEHLVAALRERFRLENNRIRRVEQLPGNIGLIKITIIPEARAAAPFTSFAKGGLIRRHQ